MKEHDKNRKKNVIESRVKYRMTFKDRNKIIVFVTKERIKGKKNLYLILETLNSTTTDILVQNSTWVANK